MGKHSRSRGSGIRGRARHLRPYDGILQDFIMLNPLRRTAASPGAIGHAIHVLRKALGTD